MCLSCGCGQVTDNHGDPRHITLRDLRDAAEAAGLTPEDVVDNIDEALLVQDEPFAHHIHNGN